MHSDLIKTLIKNNLIDEAVADSWYNKLFLTKHEQNAAPWDIFLCNLWNEKPRNSFEALSDFYESDCCVVFQGTMSGTWDSSSIKEKLAPYIKPGTTVLEYGSGGGREVICALKEGAKVIACDVSERLLTGVKLLAKEHGYELETILIKEDIPLLPSGNDVVITIDCLEHVDKPIEILNALSKSLKPGGIMYCEVFFGGHELSPYHLEKHYYLGNNETWKSVMQEAGLERIDEEGILWKKK